MAAERQQHDRLQGIERLHLQRYVWASRFARNTDAVLDIACGCGYGTFLLALMSNVAVGVDRNEDAIAWATDHFVTPNVMGHIAFIAQDAMNIPPAAPFNLITCFETLEHLEDGPAFLRHLRTLVTDQGKLVMSVPCNDPPGNPYHLAHYSIKDVGKMLSDAGFLHYEVPQNRFGILSGPPIVDDKAPYHIFVCSTA